MRRYQCYSTKKIFYGEWHKRLYMCHCKYSFKLQVYSSGVFRWSFLELSWSDLDPSLTILRNKLLNSLCIDSKEKTFASFLLDPRFVSSLYCDAVLTLNENELIKIKRLYSGRAVHFWTNGAPILTKNFLVLQYMKKLRSSPSELFFGH